MSAEQWQQQFEIAKQSFADGQYDKALEQLTALDHQFPGVFNVQYPMLQCLQRLGRLEAFKELHRGMTEAFREPAQQAKLQKAAKWRAAHQAAPAEPASTASAVPVPPPGGALNLDQIDDYLNLTPSARKPATTAVPGGMSVSIPWVPILIVVVVAAGLAAAFFTVPVLLANFGGERAFSADIVMRLPPQVHMRGKLYQKDADTSRVEIMDQVIITRGSTVHLLIPEANSYLSLDSTDFMGQDMLGEMSDFPAWIQTHGATKTGSETIQGFACDVYEGSVSSMPGIPPTAVKVWYARRLRFPIRLENELPAMMGGSITVALENIIQGGVADSLFEVPAGYTRMEGMDGMLGSMMGMEGMPGSIDDMPAPEEMERMMRDMGIEF